MFYHLNDHIYMTQFREEFILLDTKKDRYSICFKQFSKLMTELLDKDLSNSIQNFAYIEKLLTDNIIKKRAFPYPFSVDRKPHSEGVSNIDWRLPLENEKVESSIQVLRALQTLIKVNFYIKFKGLYETIQLIKKSRKNKSKYIIPEEEELQKLANIVNKACLIYPTRTKCLEWAMTFVLLALKREWKCNLEIGVQNYPFMAHAWVECNGNVVMDSQDLRNGLAIILNEPFRSVIQ